jgi:subtilisin family serine protease
MFAFAFTGVARSGELHDGMIDLLARTPSDSLVSGLVMLAEQPNARAMQNRIATLGLSSRWRQHQFIIETAQEIAARSQADLLSTLEAWKRDGAVRSYRSYWITNVVEVEAKPSVFDRLARRPDVGTIYENAPIEIRGAAEGAQAPRPTSLLSDDLICVDVAPAWQMGLRGDTRIVASFDTGVDGTHPALAARWRGVYPGVPWYAAWHDPYRQTTFPWDSSSHGTHVTGIMVATMPDGTPIGVAPHASWIAAGILIGYDVGKIIESYQWAIDPDGDPSTIDDVPDVINNSWGTSQDCDPTYWNAIDLVEAAGIVNVIAVDNSGPGYATVNSPESRAETPTVNFGVGSVDPHTPGYPISESSGRGPSPCDMVSIKPEVTAPGVAIYSTIPNGGYSEMSGASMAAPHVSGAVAILRQLNPDLTVDEVKTALMATARDTGPPGEDNTYGWGIIDIGSAVEYVKESLPLYPPRNLLTTVESDTVDLEWVRPERVNPYDPMIAYRIYRSRRDEPYPPTPIAQVQENILRFRDRGLPSGIYRYVVTASYQTGESGPSNEEIAVVGLTGSVPPSEEVSMPGLSVAPNPSHPTTVISYRMPPRGSVRLNVYNAEGLLVRSLVDQPPFSSSGSSSEMTQSILWDGRDGSGRPVPSGSYFVRLEGNGDPIVRRVTLLR